MIIIQLAGGLGNQMQQYALYQKFLSLGKEAKLDISWFQEADRQKNVYAKRELELNYFQNMKYEVCTEEEKKAFVGRKQFVFPESANPENQKMAERMRTGVSVSVHIRRGDYLDAENTAMFGNICTEEYYAGAIREMKQIYPAAHFYVFSDDIPYVREKYSGEEFTAVDINHGRDSFYDIWLMSNCRHNICANSTFSFWGARLNCHKEKIMMRPTIHKNSQRFEPEKMHDLWKEWVFLDNRGEVV